MGRQAGTKNKPKTIFVELSKLNSLFKENTIIEVSNKYAALFEMEESAQVAEAETKDEIDFVLR